MTYAAPDQPEAIVEETLLSPRFVWRLTACIAALAVLTVLVSATGRIVGRHIATGGHTADTSTREIIIGNNALVLPANVIRFERQRVDGIQTSVDLYLQWPEMEGYSDGARARFNNIALADRLIFVGVSRATMSRDMSGRYEMIYRHLIEKKRLAGPAGLDGYRLRETAGYVGETLYVEHSPTGEPFVVRCLEDESAARDLDSHTLCQRDIHIGDDLSANYRFSPRLLPEWRSVDAAIRNYLKTRLAR